ETLFITENPNYGGNLYVFRVNPEPLTSGYSNLVMNPSFELEWDSSIASPAWWEQRGDKRWMGELDKSIKSSGNYSYRIETSVTEKAWEGFLRSELIEVEEGKTYLMSVKVKTENSKGTHFHIYTYEDGDIGLTIGYTPMPEGTQDWKEYSQHIEIPKGVTVIRIFLRA
ncbi:unnamed protein product, partial [marine sediment metagenome]